MLRVRPVLGNILLVKDHKIETLARGGFFGIVKLAKFFICRTGQSTNTTIFNLAIKEYLYFHLCSYSGNSPLRQFYCIENITYWGVSRKK